MNETNGFVCRNKLASTCQQTSVRLVAILLAGLVLAGAGCAKNEPGSRREQASVAVRVAPVTKQDLAQRIGYVGTVSSRREVQVLARIAGTVLSLTREGKTVRQGQTIARITAPEIDERVSRMNAEVQRAQTERDFLCGTYDTDRDLGTKGIITKRQVDMSRKACDAATAALSAARAGSREVGASEWKTSEQAPFGGLVLRWLVEPGQNVMPGTPLMLLGSHDLEVRVQVAESDLDRGVREAIPSLVRLRGKAHRLPVSSVAPLAVGPGRTAAVKIALPSELVPPPAHGTSARVDFLAAEVAGAIAIPEKAIMNTDGADDVFVIDDGRARAIAVTSGIRDRGLIGVKGEISVGEWVAVSNLDRLRDGASVFAVRLPDGDEVRP